MNKQIFILLLFTCTLHVTKAQKVLSIINEGTSLDFYISLIGLNKTQFQQAFANSTYAKQKSLMGEVTMERKTWAGHFKIIGIFKNNVCIHLTWNDIAWENTKLYGGERYITAF